LPTASQTQQQKPLAFFSFQAANPDGFDHLQASFTGNGGGQLTLKWEDLTGGGDQDFDDTVFTATGFKGVSGGSTSTNTVFTYDADALDADGDTLTYSLTQAPQGATINSTTGLINWTASAAGTYTFNVAASDGKGGSTTQTFTLTVKNAPAPNRLPIASNDNATVDEDGTVKINVLTNDSDADGNTLTANVVTGPANGSLTKNADGSYSYTPKKDWFGTDSFTYKANDGTGDSALATVTITVKPVNDAPKAQNASYTVNKDGSIKIDLRGLTSDVDDDCLDICVTNPGKGTLSKNRDGTYTYTPRRGYTGVDSFSYTVSDGRLSASGTINLNVGQGSGGGGACAPSSASIVVSSSATSNSSPSNANNQIRYVVVNSATTSSTSSPGSSATSSSTASSSTSTTTAINWQATGASSSSASISNSGSNWLSQLLRSGSEDENEGLAKSTGLRVKL
jgi:VCBS repeat-containing protein